MESTLAECIKLRPNAQWGYYRFPDCHNNNQFPSCGPRGQEWDDETDWLWNMSTSIYPSSYIGYKARDSKNITEYVQNRTLEAWRILPNEEIPIYHYLR